jgi:hypothetical protein
MEMIICGIRFWLFMHNEREKCTFASSFRSNFKIFELHLKISIELFKNRIQKKYFFKIFNNSHETDVSNHLHPPTQNLCKLQNRQREPLKKAPQITRDTVHIAREREREKCEVNKKGIN